MVVGNTRQSIFPPMVSARPCLIVGKIIPGISIVAVILANRAPLSFAKVRSPFPPGGQILMAFPKPRILCLVSIRHTFLLHVNSSQEPPHPRKQLYSHLHRAAVPKCAQPGSVCGFGFGPNEIVGGLPPGVTPGWSAGG